MSNNIKKNTSVADAFSRSAKPEDKEPSETVQNDLQGADGEKVDQSSIHTIEDLAGQIQGIYKERTNKKKVEDTHTRTTFLLRNDLLNRLNKVSAKKKGYKTLILNKAVEAILDQMDGKK